MSAARMLLGAALVLTPIASLAARDSLGVFDDWGAFRDPAGPLCYAIAEPEKNTGPIPSYADIGTWPRKGIRGQVHFRLSRELASAPRLSLALAGTHYQLTGSGADAWAQDKRADAAIVAAMRSAESMTVSAIDKAGRRFSDRFSLKGAATAMDAATVGCAQVR